MSSLKCDCLLQAAEKDSLATKAKADVIISMLPLIDNFERASGQIKAESEQEQKIDAAYQVRVIMHLKMSRDVQGPNLVEKLQNLIVHHDSDVVEKSAAQFAVLHVMADSCLMSSPIKMQSGHG